MSVSKGAVRQLGAALKALRLAAELTLRQLAAKVPFSNPTISMWENGHRLPSTEDLNTLLDALDVSDEERERVLGLRRDADDAPGQIAAGAPTIGAQLAQLISHEQTASRIVDVAPLLIPGLLQTSAYARAIMGELPDADLRVGLRSGRRDILTRRNPVELLAFIDSEVLIRPVAPQDVMVDQLRHLLAMAGRPNITIQIVSSTRPGYNPMLAGPFELIEFPEAKPIVLLEHHRSSLTLWEEEDVKEFTEAADAVRNAAMTPAESTGVIEDIVNGMETTNDDGT
jgi:transcriptional regulator with XRE-family HTH domain